VAAEAGAAAAAGPPAAADSAGSRAAEGGQAARTVGARGAGRPRRMGRSVVVFMSSSGRPCRVVPGASARAPARTLGGAAYAPVTRELRPDLTAGVRRHVGSAHGPTARSDAPSEPFSFRSKGFPSRRRLPHDEPARAQRSGGDAVSRIVLTSFGSFGDLNPYLGLGRALQARGHQVRLAMPALYRELVEREGLEHRAVRPDLDVQNRALA